MREIHSTAATEPPILDVSAPGASDSPASSDRCGALLSGFREVVRIGSATLIRADSLDVLAALEPGSIGGVLSDPPYSSGGLHAGDRARAPSQKYQGSEHRHLHADFAGDNRDQRSFLAWSGLWMARARLAMRPGAILGAFTDGECIGYIVFSPTFGRIAQLAISPQHRRPSSSKRNKP